MNTLKIEIFVKVYGEGSDSYKDPDGSEYVTLTCLDGGISELLAPSDVITSALIKVCHAKYLEAVAEKQEGAK